MKFVSAIFTASIFVFAESGFTQSFVNLDFESAQISGYPPEGTFPIAIALPGWNGYAFGSTHGTLPITEVYYEDAGLVIPTANISLEDTNSRLAPVQGNYSVLFHGTFSDHIRISAAIGQTGQIQADAQSLLFSGGFSGQVTFDGQPIAYTAIGSVGQYTIYGGDVSAYAGRTGELLFSTPNFNISILDDIQFSSQPIPEPSGLALFGAGTLFLGFFRRRYSWQ
jgi:hypothetical protein